MKIYSDNILLTLLQKEDSRAEAFRALVSQYSQNIYWHIRRIVLVHEDADDVLQETFIKAWQNIDSFRGDSKILTWLYRIATNESLTHLRKNKKESQFDIDNPEFDVENVLQSDSYFDGDEAVIKLQKAILRLPEKQRLVFMMKYYDDMKYSEISKVLDTSVGALKASYHHAVTKIEEYLKEEH